MRLAEHPFQSDLRQAAFVFRIAAADVGMNAGKPHLAEVLTWPRMTPEIVLIETAPFIDRYGLAADIDDGIRSEKWKLDGIPGPSIRTHCVPHPAEADAHFPYMRELPLEGEVGFECPSL